MRTNGLEGVYVLSRSLRVTADATGMAGRRADLLRLDLGRVEGAFSGRATIAPAYAFGNLTVLTGYFPIARGDGAVSAVLVLEAGRSFVAAQTRITRARDLGVSLSIVSALALALVAARWNRVERERRAAAARAARGEALSRVAAMAAHEIRNPLGVIRGTVDLMRERSGATLVDRDRVALNDIAEEVERLRRLTQDLLDLSADRPLHQRTGRAGRSARRGRARDRGGVPEDQGSLRAGGAPFDRRRRGAPPAGLRQPAGQRRAGARRGRGVPAGEE